MPESKVARKLVRCAETQMDQRISCAYAPWQDINRRVLGRAAAVRGEAASSLGSLLDHVCPFLQRIKEDLLSKVGIWCPLLNC